MRSLFFPVIVCLAFFVSCSVPNLESSDCTAARSELKKLYSIHFDRGFAPDEDYPNERDKYLTPELAARIDRPEGPDYLTGTSDYPKAFRIGSCTESGTDTLKFGILLFWKDDTRNEQRRIEAEMKRTGNEWKLDSVEIPKE